MKIGSHVSNNGSEMLLGSVKEALSYGANALMVYLGAPQNTFRKPLELLKASEAIKLAVDNGINPDDIIVHAPYIVNLAQYDDSKFDFGVKFIAQELRNVHLIGAKYLVLHPGAHMGRGSEEGIKRISYGINQIHELTKECSSVIAIETMAGKGTECGKTFEEIAKIIELVNDKSRIAVCLDTCHINDAGYDIVNDYEKIFVQFNEIVGFKYLKVIHINDSKNVLGAKKDRHENIGFGYIGFDTILKICNDERFVNIPKILETPYIGEFAPYKYEIEMLKNKVFITNLKEKIEAQD